MKFATYQQKDTYIPAAVSADGSTIHALSSLGYQYASLTELIAAYTPALGQEIASRMAETSGLPLEEVTLASPIPQPRHDYICVGVNYYAHAVESARAKGKEYVKPAYPQYFSKRIVQPVGHDGNIPLHGAVTQSLDYEAELAVIIGKTCKNVPAENAFDYVFGYSVANDISARDIQNRHLQFYFGKSLDGSGPMGPWIVTADEVAAPPYLPIRSYVNGEKRQDSNTRDFIFDIPYIISQLSSCMTLEAGDIILTGTPSGVGMGFQPPKYLKAGDVVECEIEGIGLLRNTVR